ncbi:porin [Aurantimonas sp. Leaf443]|uniref:porin n=1 Tax=Aurantimonas sp. Leaf443 TaxID=1736378 RepID=UPI000B060F1A
MTIKSLLLGSAAALVAVTGARAADVIVPAAAEPAEYVKVCDVYGTGFYYIPGTETCLQISGYVRFKVYAADNSSNSEGDDYRSTTETRVRLNFDVREETELGTLRAFARVQATNGGSFTDQPYSMDLGYIQLGGLTMGYLDTLWTEGDGLLTDTDLPVGGRCLLAGRFARGRQFGRLHPELRRSRRLRVRPVRRLSRRLDRLQHGRLDLRP